MMRLFSKCKKGVNYYTHDREGNNLSPFIYVRSFKREKYEQIERDIYKVPVEKSMLKDYNKLLHGQWSKLTSETTVSILKTMKQPAIKLMGEIMKRSIQGYCIYMRDKLTKVDAETILDLAETLQKDSPEMELWERLEIKLT